MFITPTKMLMNVYHYYKTLNVLIVLSFSVAGCMKCQDDTVNPKDLEKDITLAAQSSRQWTGVAVSNTSRVFANYPNWSPDHSTSVIEVTDTSNMRPYPDEAWNTWADGMSPQDHFICVQSVVIDKNDFLWVLDPANIQRNGEFSGVVNGGVKLLKFNLNTNTVAQKIVFNEPVIKRNSYLNDVRIDEERQVAYITDSNEGALIIVNLQDGSTRRLLDTDPSTKSENKIISIDGTPYRNSQGEFPVIHADGLALTPDRSQLYWRPLTGQSLYRIATDFLLDESLSESELSSKVEKVASYIPPSDGIEFDPNGSLYLTSIEENAIRLFDGKNSTKLFKKTAGLKWPDSFACQGGYLYVTTSQIHISNPTDPYRIYKIKIDSSEP